MHGQIVQKDSGEIGWKQSLEMSGELYVPLILVYHEVFNNDIFTINPRWFRTFSIYYEASAFSFA